MLETMMIRQKMRLLPLLTAASFAVLILGTLLLSGRIGDEISKIENGYFRAVELRRDMEVSLTELQQGLRDAVAAADQDAIAAAETSFERLQQRIAEERDNPTLDRADLDATARMFATHFELAKATSTKMILGESGPETVAQIQRMTESYKELREHLATRTRQTKDSIHTVFAPVRRAVVTQMAAIALVAVLCTLGLFLLYRKIDPSAALIALRGVFDRVASGDLAGDAHEIASIQRADEVGQIAASAERMRQNLRHLARQLADSSKRMQTAASEVADLTHQQELGATQQAAAIEETRRTMDALLESSKAISMSSQTVLQNAEKAAENSRVVAGTYAELSGQVQRIGEILEAIKEIANKSELLALNAALEGTKAGEAGRGFSLVAAQMQRLAETIMASVQDIKGLVADVRSSSAAAATATEDGAQLAEQTTSSAHQIRLVTSQQQSGTEQVSTSMREAAAHLSQTVTGIGQTAESMRDLARLSEELSALVVQFKLD